MGISKFIHWDDQGEGRKICEETMYTLRALGGDWAVYQNHALDSSSLGHLKFLKYGNGCTFETPPDRYPDTSDAIGWRYVFVGYVDIKEGVIVDERATEGSDT
jgi:hypothetical protein